jgi:hypothetical protein
LVRPKEKEGSQSIFDYVKYFDRVVEANGWNDYEAGKIFPAMLGPADRTLDSFQGRWETFSDIKELLLEKQKPLREAKLAELLHLKIQEGEQVEALRNRTLRIVAETYPDFPQEIQIQLARDHFLHALDDNVRIQVLVAKPTTLEDTVSMAQACTLLIEKSCVSSIDSRRDAMPRTDKTFYVRGEKFQPSSNNGTSKPSLEIFF